VPYEVVKAVAGNTASEVLITFAPSFLTRFGQIRRTPRGGRSSVRRHSLAGSRQPTLGPQEGLFGDGLPPDPAAGRLQYTLTLEMVDESNHALFLIFGTSNDTGLAKMKEAMWTVDPETGVRYRDPRDVNQTLPNLEFEPDTTLLGRMLM
jgi:hypothetical protein